MVSMKEVVATANANVALAKYWGKRDAALNLPYTGSLSVTLAGLTTTARASFLGGFSEDRVLLGGREADGIEAQRFRAFLRSHPTDRDDRRQGRGVDHQ
jgi:diphosphomevalonate decarboxylase